VCTRVSGVIGAIVQRTDIGYQCGPQKIHSSQMNEPDHCDSSSELSCSRGILQYTAIDIACIFDIVVFKVRCAIERMIASINDDGDKRVFSRSIGIDATRKTQVQTRAKKQRERERTRAHMLCG
jgi:hypothetical protein